MLLLPPPDPIAYLDALEQLYASMGARQWYGDHICLAAHPVSQHGSVDALVAHGVESSAEVAGAWGAELAQAVDGLTEEWRIRAAIARAAEAIDVTAFAELLFDRMMMGLMLGGLDAQLEHETPDAGHIPVEPVAKLRNESPFVYLPRTEAIKLWEQRDVLPRPAYDFLEKEARKRAFTFAGAARDEMLNVVHAEIGRQLKEGNVGFQSFRKNVEKRLETSGWAPTNPTHLETIFRTNVASALASGRRAEMTQPSVIENLPLWQILGVRDARQRPTHKAAFGIVLPARHPFWLKAYPPFGWNCFLPGTEVRGNFIGGSRAPYAGKAIELTTAKGRRIAVTANHPVLTTGGFVPAQSIRQGRQLLCYRGQPGVEPLGLGAKRDEHEAPARAEDVFRALTKAAPVDLARPRANDFHGEATRFVGDVEVVGSYGNLLSELREAARAQFLCQLDFEATHTFALRSGAQRELLGRDLAAASSRPGAAALASDPLGIGTDSPPLHSLRIGLPAQYDTMLTEDASEGLSTDADLIRQLLQGSSGDVAVDEVTGVREFDFCGHVYDFQTVTGWLVADSALVSNCRCRVISRSLRWLQRNGNKIGPVPLGLPDPGFDGSGKRGLIAVPDELLRPTAPKTLQPPAATGPAGAVPSRSYGLVPETPTALPQVRPQQVVIAAPVPLRPAATTVPSKPPLRTHVVIGWGRKVKLTESQQLRDQTARWLRESPAARRLASTEEHQRYLQWEWVNGSNRRSSVVLKHAARVEFKLDGELWTAGKQFHVGAEEIRMARAVTRRMKQETLEYFRQRGIKTVRLYRGVHGEYSHRGAVESWTSSRKKAEDFARRGGPTGMVLELDVPVESILTHHKMPTWVNGPWGHQAEYLVMR